MWAHGTSGEPIEILDLALSQDGSFVYTAGEDGAVCQFAATSGTLLRRLHEHRRPCTCVRTAPDGVLYTAGDRPAVVRWETTQIAMGDSGSAVRISPSPLHPTDPKSLLPPLTSGR